MSYLKIKFIETFGVQVQLQLSLLSSSPKSLSREVSGKRRLFEDYPKPLHEFHDCYLHRCCMARTIHFTLKVYFGGRAGEDRVACRAQIITDLDTDSHFTFFSLLAFSSCLLPFFPLRSSFLFYFFYLLLSLSLSLSLSHQRVSIAFHAVGLLAVTLVGSLGISKTSNEGKIQSNHFLLALKKRGENIK